ncbi:MAG TPA: LuxR C-terminal-related transcriptional regulator [Usitatibacteraceae bacterium]|nr:LuxR C-terminal-related transcriptional regulator [Usitatibacteraceae bacterium]
MTSQGKRGRPPHADQLTPAEWRVVQLVRHGLSNPRIAAQLGVSPDAVKFHVANILMKTSLADRRAIRHWDAIAKSSLLHGKETTMNDALSLGAIGQIARTVADIKAAESWYKDVLRLPHLYTFGNLAFFDCGGVRLFLSEGDGGGGGDGASILYFRVADIHAAHAALKARGAEFTDAPHMIHRHADGTEEWLNFFKDNEGRPLAILAQVKPEAH